MNTYCPGCMRFVAVIGPHALQPANEIGEHSGLNWHRSCLEECVAYVRARRAVVDALNRRCGTLGDDVRRHDHGSPPGCRAV